MPLQFQSIFLVKDVGNSFKDVYETDIGRKQILKLELLKSLCHLLTSLTVIKNNDFPKADFFSSPPKMCFQRGWQVSSQKDRPVCEQSPGGRHFQKFAGKWNLKLFQYKAWDACITFSWCFMNCVKRPHLHTLQSFQVQHSSGLL